MERLGPLHPYVRWGYTRLRGRLLIAMAALVGLLNLVVLLVQAPQLVYSLYLSADNASSLILPAAATQAPSPTVTLGNYHFYEAWLVEVLTRGMPDVWRVWEGIPFLIAFLAIGLLGWAAWRVYGALAGALSAVLLLAMSDEMRQILLTPATHGYFVFHAVFLSAALVVVGQRAVTNRLRWWFVAVAVLISSAMTMMGATDQLFEFVCLPALVATGCLAMWAAPSWTSLKVAVFSVAVAGLSLLGAQEIDTAMAAGRIVSSHFPIQFVAPGSILNNLDVAVTAIANLGGGDFFGGSVKGVQVLTFVIGLLVLGGAVTILRTMWRTSSWEPGAEGPSAEFFFRAFWHLVAGISFVLFLFTSLPVDALTARYLPGLYTAGAALLPAIAVRATGRRSLAAPALLAFAALVAAAHLANGVPAYGPGSSRPVAQRIFAFLRREGAFRGYAPYWDAAVVSMQTRDRLQAYPVSPCPAGLCAFPLNRLSTWYGPVRGVRSFVLLDPRTSVPQTFGAVPPRFGRPIASSRIGPYTVEVFAHDVAADLG